MKRFWQYFCMVPFIFQYNFYENKFGIFPEFLAL